MTVSCSIEMIYDLTEYLYLDICSQSFQCVQVETQYPSYVSPEQSRTNGNMTRSSERRRDSQPVYADGCYKDSNNSENLILPSFITRDFCLSQVQCLIKITYFEIIS